jgi:nucleotide-binding universal stress UspA family protein
MFNNVMIGVDGHEGGEDALALGRELLTEGGALTLAHVHAGYIMLSRGDNYEFEARERARADRLLEQARAKAGIETALRSTGSPSVGRGLHELAEEIGADLLVVGSSRRSLFGRVWLSHDTHAALNGAPCAIAIAPAGYAQHPHLMREIGVAYNGSRESEHALGVARRLAAEHGAKLSAFEAVGIPTVAFIGIVVPSKDTIEDLVDEARERIADLGDVEPHAVYGRPAEELALYGASLDLLVVGSRDYGPVGRLVHGSTAQELARTARCPLLVLTRAARAADAADSGREAEAAAEV